MKQIRFGIIGAGRIGQIHVENLSCHLPEACVVAISDAMRHLAEQVAAQNDIIDVFPDYRELLRRPDIDAVAICTSTESHAKIIHEAAAAGKHIFCEKPIALDLDTIDSALAVVSEAGVLLQIGFQRRFDPNFRKASKMIESGQIGRPHIVRITSRDPEPPPLDYIKKSGGIFLDMTIHDFDMAHFLVKDEVVEIQAFGNVLVDPAIGAAGDIDTAVSVLRFKRGALCVIDNSRKSTYGYDQRVEIFGSGGMITVGNKFPDTTSHCDGAGIHRPAPLHFFLERYQDAYREEMKSFLEAILFKREPEVTGADGRLPVVMAHAAIRSMSENRPVRLTEIQ